MKGGCAQTIGMCDYVSEIEAMPRGHQSTMGWSNGGNGTNSSGFSGLPDEEMSLFHADTGGLHRPMEVWHGILGQTVTRDENDGVY